MQALATRLRRPSPAILARIVTTFAQGLKGEIGRQFRVGGDPAWPPLAPNTLAGRKWRASRGMPGTRGQAILGGAGGGLYRRGSGVRTLVEMADAGRRWRVSVYMSGIARLHQEGRRGPWTITARRAPFLSFPVARTARSSVKTRRVSVTVGWVRARSVRHPGYPARPFVRVTDGLLRASFREPLARTMQGGARP